MTKRSYWHKPTGVCVSEAFYVYETARGTYPKEDFEEVLNLSHSTPLSDPSGIIAPSPTGRTVTLHGGPPEVIHGALLNPDPSPRQRR